MSISSVDLDGRSVAHSRAMSRAPVPVAVVDVLNGLLDAAQNSIFRVMNESAPYLSRAAADVRRPLQQMVETNARHVQELAGLIQDLGGEPTSRGIRADEQYLAYLSMKFLLPKLAEEKKLTIQRYENAIKAIGNATPTASAILQAHLSDHRADLATLDRAAAELLAKKG